MGGGDGFPFEAYWDETSFRPTKLDTDEYVVGFIFEPKTTSSLFDPPNLDNLLIEVILNWRCYA